MQSYIDQVVEVVRNPTSNLVVAALLLAAVTLLVLILVLVALIFLMPSRKKAEDVEGDEPQERPSIRKPRTEKRQLPAKVQFWLFTGIVVATLATAYGVTSTNDYCTNTCHVMAPAATTWAEAAHADVSCVRCHEGRLIVSLPVAVTSRIRELSAELAGGGPDTAVVPSSVCLGCHERQLRGSVQTSSGLIVSHAEPIEAGMSCETCHLGVAHARKAESRASIMTQCLLCHDGEKAPADCGMCHAGDPGDTPMYDRIYPMTDLPQPTCGGCHSEESCDACHGIRMPHSREFIEGEHARDAGFYRKELCWNCHLEADCGSCHGTWDAHGPDFVQTHKYFRRDSQCTTCHRQHEGSFCDRCHE